MSNTEPILAVDGLTIDYAGSPRAVDEVSFSIGRGERVALIGESGSGKSTTAQALIGLLPDGARITNGTIDFDGHNLAALRTERSWRPFRGRRITLVPQDPNTALNPVRKIGLQLTETLRLHTGLRGKAADAEAAHLLGEVGLTDTRRVLAAYPHELSGGMRQRVLLALAVAPRPDLIIADEPTSGLDVTVQRLILDMLDQLCSATSTSLLLITHNLAVARERAQRIVVLQRGRVVDSGTSEALVGSSTVAYTKALFEAAPSLHSAKLQPTWSSPAPAPDSADDIVTVAGVTKSYRRRTTLYSSQQFAAVSDVSFRVRRGTSFGIVGESGSGKSTLMRLVAGFESPDSGSVDISDLNPGTRVQYVFQNPYSSLNPRMRIEDIVAEPLEVKGPPGRAERRSRAREVLQRVGLEDSYARRHPGELSGGQRQRVAIARALVADSPLIVLDEPVSSLDVSVQAQVLQLLVDLQAEFGLTYLFVTHDLAVVRLMCDEVAVIDGGRLVEQGPVAEILTAPKHPKTRELISAIPLSGVTG